MYMQWERKKLIPFFEEWAEFTGQFPSILHVLQLDGNVIEFIIYISCTFPVQFMLRKPGIDVKAAVLVHDTHYIRDILWT